MARSTKQLVPRFKRSLRIVISTQEAPLLGECTRCSRRFKGQSHRNDISEQYEAHLCDIEDVRRTGEGILSRAGLSFFS